MANLILHKDGAYNIYGTIADGPHYTSALTLAELQDAIRFEYGAQGLRELPERLERAHATGCSHVNGWTLEECVDGNRCGPGETQMPFNEFVSTFLTLEP